MSNDDLLVFCKECEKVGYSQWLSVNAEYCPHCGSDDFMPSEKELTEWRKWKDTESVALHCRACFHGLTFRPGYDDKDTCIHCGEPQINSYQEFLKEQGTDDIPTIGGHVFLWTMGICIFITWLFYNWVMSF